MQDVLIRLGLVLFLLGLLTGMAVAMVRNPRMAVASHLQGVTNGPFLVLIGLLWPRVHLPHAVQIATVVLLVYGSCANWLATQLGAVWGAGRRYAPLATGEHSASPGRERVVDLLLVTLAPAMVLATISLIVGVLR